MHPVLPGRRRHTARAAVILAGAVTTALIGMPAAHGDPPYCSVPGRLGCTIEKPGNSSGGNAPPSGGTSIPEAEDPDVENNFQDLGEADPTTAELAQQVSDSAAFPAVRVHTAPEGRTYVRVRTALWVDGFQTVQTDPITLAGQTVQATATPRSVTWNLGETTITCNGPGRPNDTSCSHAYQRSSAREPGRAYRVSATVTWDVTWTCEGAACDAEAGPLPDNVVPSVPTPLVVDEIQTNTRP
jgi:hypothetical protein